MIGFGKEGNLSKYFASVGVKNWDSVDQLKGALINNIHVAEEIALVPPLIQGPG